MAKNKNTGLEEARNIAEDALGVLLTEDSVLLYIEGELNLPDGAIQRAYRVLQRAGKEGGGKIPKIDREEIFYSLCVDDIFLQAEELGISKKKLTPEKVKEIKETLADNLIERLNEIANEDIRDTIIDVTGGR